MNVISTFDNIYYRDYMNKVITRGDEITLDDIEDIKNYALEILVFRNKSEYEIVEYDEEYKPTEDKMLAEKAKLTENVKLIENIKLPTLTPLPNF